MPRSRFFAVLFLLAITALPPLPAEPARDETVVVEDVRSREARFRVRRMITGLEHPWSITFLSDETYLVTERPGRLLRVGPEGIEEISGLPRIYPIGQGGLLDVIADPNFQENRLIYFTYSAREGLGAGTRLMRAELREERLTRQEELFSMERGGGGGRHFGSRIVIGPDGHIYMTIGDRGQMERAQDPGDHAGKTLRLTTEGGVPRDNPFIRRMDALPELFTLGNRNAQGMAVHPETGEIWQHEHGPRGGDEVNIIEAGVNYGWPEVTYGRAYSGGTIGPGTHEPRFREPVLHWTPSIAPSGMAFYTGSAFPAWEGDLFVGALAGRHLRRVELDGERVVRQEELLSGTLGRIRDVEVGPDGFLYLLTDADNGGVYRLEPVR
jgi:glucose/arabinose dehydrogenase